MSRAEVDHDSSTLTEYSWEVLSDLAETKFHKWVIRQGFNRDGRRVEDAQVILEKLKQDTNDPAELARFDKWLASLSQLRPNESLSVIVSLIHIRSQR